MRLRALENAPAAFGSTLAEWQLAEEVRWRDRLSEVPFNVVAMAGGEPVGQASGTQVDHEERAELISMWVAPTARGAGVADVLITAVVAYAARMGARAVRLSVRRHNERAIARYTRCGFVLADEPGDEPAEVAMVHQVQP